MTAYDKSRYGKSIYTAWVSVWQHLVQWGKTWQKLVKKFMTKDVALVGFSASFQITFLDVLCLWICNRLNDFFWKLNCRSISGSKYKCKFNFTIEIFTIFTFSTCWEDLCPKAVQTWVHTSSSLCSHWSSWSCCLHFQNLDFLSPQLRPNWEGKA